QATVPPSRAAQPLPLPPIRRHADACQLPGLRFRQTLRKAPVGCQRGAAPARMEAMAKDRSSHWIAPPGCTGDAYEAVFEVRAASGQDVHGEADFVQALGARSVLDAGCGTGRVGRELARRGLEVVGVDLDPAMI